MDKDTRHCEHEFLGKCENCVPDYAKKVQDVNRRFMELYLEPAYDIDAVATAGIEQWLKTLEVLLEDALDIGWVPNDSWPPAWEKP